MLECQGLLPTNISIIGSPFLNAFLFALKSWKEDPDQAQAVLGENQQMLTFADANEAHRWAQAHLPVGRWGILKVKLRLTW